MKRTLSDGSVVEVPDDATDMKEVRLVMSPRVLRLVRRCTRCKKTPSADGGVSMTPCRSHLAMMQVDDGEEEALESGNE